MYQKLIVLGNLGRDPEMRYTPNGTAVTTFSMATNRKYTGADGQPRDETCWFRVTVWGKQAEACNQYLSKGSRVLVEGTLQAGDDGSPRIWTGQDGKPRASFEVRADTVRFMGKSAGNGAPEPGQASDGDASGEDVLPF